MPNTKKKTKLEQEEEEQVPMSFDEKIDLLSIAPKQIALVSVKPSTNFRDLCALFNHDKLYSVPVVENDKCLGLISLEKITQVLLQSFLKVAGISIDSNHKAEKLEERLNGDSFSSKDLEKVAEDFFRHIVADNIDIPYDPLPVQSSLKDAIIKLQKNTRLPLADQKGHVVGVCSQSVLTTYVNKNISKLSPSASTDTVKDKIKITSPVTVISEANPTLLTFLEMCEKGYSSMGFVDEEDEDSIIGVISQKDILSSFTKLSALLLPTGEYVHQIRRDDKRNMSRDSFGTINVLSSDTVSKAISKIVSVGTHRLFVRDPESQNMSSFFGIITLGSILKSFI